ncbi:hypothetical protein EIP91_011806 [Steccherinum ochraceum]|uniref:SnoaL-like domain-containing protein n=1 Tax=Steccherinum ochraceum TaxID=92696 RepID=A0A4R0RLA7_9APHY|nr:hypothetical protein EIP91_011806 [Steccherinum ochraceum]
MSLKQAVQFSPGVSPKPSAQARPCYDWMDALVHSNVDGLAMTLADGYAHEMLTHDPTYPVLEHKKACIEFWSWLLPNFRKFILTVEEVKETPGEVVIQAASDIETQSGHKYRQGYSLTFSVGQQLDGSYKLTHAKELFKDTDALVLLRRDLGDL